MDEDSSSSLSLSDEDEGEQCEMDVEDPEEEEHVESQMLQFPAAVPLIELNQDGTQFRFLANHISDTLPSIPPSIMKAMATLTEATSKQKAGISFHSCMPMPVHASPLVSLFANKFVLPKGATVTVMQQRPFKDKYVSFMFSCYQLQQLKLACLNGLIPFHPSFTERKLLAAHVEYQHQIKRIGNAQDSALDALYAKAIGKDESALIVSMQAVMAEFVSLLETYSLQYIHLLEYFIHTCLIEPHNQNAAAGKLLPLESCLTPNECPPLSACTAQQQENIMQDLVAFFQHKVSYRADQEQRNTAEHVQNTDAASAAGSKINVAAIMPSVKARQQELYNGYIPLSTLYEYFCFLDCDGVLNPCRPE